MLAKSYPNIIQMNNYLHSRVAKCEENFPCLITLFIIAMIVRLLINNNFIKICINAKFPVYLHDRYTAGVPTLNSLCPLNKEMK